MRPQLKWLVLATLFAGHFFPAITAAAQPFYLSIPELYSSAQEEACSSDRNSEFDVRQFARRSMHDPRCLPNRTPELRPTILSSATAASDGDADPTAARPTLLALHSLLQP